MNRGYTPSEIAQIMGGKLVNGQEVRIQQYLIDSRKAFAGLDILFIAIVTSQQDGHNYVQSAYERGVRCFLVQHEMTLGVDAIQIVVKDTVTALQQLAIHHRRRFSIPVIGITGSNGKTIVKEWLNQLLSSHYRICRSPRSYNSQIGVALSVLQLHEGHEMAIFEAGISQPNEMSKLAQIIEPTIGVFTHLGESHLENFSGKEQLFSEKNRLFQNTTAWISPDLGLTSASLQPLSWGISSSNHWVIRSIDKGHEYSMIELEEAAKRVILTIPFQDQIQIGNAITAACAARYLGLTWQQIQDEIGNLSSIGMRMEQLTGVHQTVLINDAYSFDVASLNLAMQEVKQRYSDRKRVLICSDFPSIGARQPQSYEELFRAIEHFEWTEIFFVGTGFFKMQGAFKCEVHYCSDTYSLIATLEKKEWREEVILIKGAREFEFEKVVQRLQASTHLTRLEIDLNALRSNLHYYRSKIGPSTRMMVMVKAFGYGTGAKEVAQLLEENQVDYLGVAYIDEGLALRKAGVSLPIMVMNPESEGIHSLIQFHLEPEIYSLRSFNDWMAQKDRYQITSTLKIHLKIDTGMHRLGLSEGDWEKMKNAILSRNDVEVISVFTHLSSADVEEEQGFTLSQLDQFQKARAYFEPYFPNAFYHAANSAAITHYPQSQMDMVRLGIGIYGVSSDEEDQKHLQPVHRWVSHISQLIKVPKGDAVGYGRSYIAHEAMTIATIPVGYADGYKRILSNGKGWALISGAVARVVGRVCMDMLMLDVTHLNVKEGDEVVLMGEEMTLTEMAGLCDTIPYEILTSISQRVKRVYIAT
jgi:alanine racemase